MRIATIGDVHGWSFDFWTRGWAAYSKHEVVYFALNEFRQHHLDEYDVFMFLPHYDEAGYYDVAKMMRYATTIRGVHSFLEARDKAYDPRHWRAVACVSRQIYEKMHEDFPMAENLFCFRNPVDGAVFVPAQEIGDSIGWTGGTHEKKRRHILEQIAPDVVVKSDYGKQFFVKGRSRDDQIQFYHSLRCYVHPSYAESMSLTVLEAAACGLPVVACNVGDNMYLFDKEWLVDPYPEDECVEKMKALVERLRTDKDLAKAVGQDNRKRFEQEGWCWSSVAPEYDALVARMVEEPSNPRVLKTMPLCNDELHEENLGQLGTEGTEGSKDVEVKEMTKPKKDTSELRIKVVVMSHNQKETTDELYRALSPVFDVSVFDSGSDPDQIPDTVTHGYGNLYWTGCWNEAMRLYRDTCDVLWVIGGDVTLLSNPHELKHSIQTAYPFGCWSPSICGFSRIIMSEGLAARRLLAVYNLEGVCMAVSNDLIEHIYPLPEQMSIGWGQDLYMSHVSRAKDMVNYLDGRVYVHHPKGSGYPKKKARQQMQRWFQNNFGHHWWTQLRHQIEDFDYNIRTGGDPKIENIPSNVIPCGRGGTVESPPTNTLEKMPLPQKQEKPKLEQKQESETKEVEAPEGHVTQKVSVLTVQDGVKGIVVNEFLRVPPEVNTICTFAKDFHVQNVMPFIQMVAPITVPVRPVVFVMPGYQDKKRVIESLSRNASRHNVELQLVDASSEWFEKELERVKVAVLMQGGSHSKFEARMCVKRRIPMLMHTSVTVPFNFVEGQECMWYEHFSWATKHLVRMLADEQFAERLADAATTKMDAYTDMTTVKRWLANG